MTDYGTHTEEQHELRAVVRRFLERVSPESEVRRLMATPEGFDPAVWQQLSAELELCGLGVPTSYGGSGGGFAETAIVLTELGASLACLPYFSSVVLAQGALSAAQDDEATSRWLPELAAGRVRGTLAGVREFRLGDNAETTDVQATTDSTGWRLAGSTMFVLDGCTADLILVIAGTDAGPSLFAVEGDAPGFVRTPMRTLDETRKQATLAFADTPAVPVGELGEGTRIASRVLDRAAIGLAAEQVGGAQRALDMAVEYAKIRRQFGRTIGSFQAIKHKCADMLIAVESARSAAEYAAWTADSGDVGRTSEVASIAKALCSEAYFAVARENIQVHGGIGFTWEHPAHLYFRRAKSSELMFGDPNFHRERVAGCIERVGGRS
jgi:alkylation response protein AidB-like acyl-CoA dehydrogenase